MNKGLVNSRAERGRDRNPGAAGTAVTAALVFLLAGLVPYARPGRVPIERHAWSLVVPNEPQGFLADINVESPEGPFRVRIERASEDNPQSVDILGRMYSLKASRPYVLQFRARSRDEWTINVSIVQDHAPWNSLGLSRTIHLKEFWQTFELPFVPDQDEPQAAVRISLEGKTGVMEWDRVSLVVRSNQAGVEHSKEPR